MLLTGDFPPFDSTPTVLFGDVPADPVEIVDESTLRVVSPPASEPGARVPVEVLATDYDITTTTEFVYTPRIEGVENPGLGGALYSRSRPG